MNLSRTRNEQYGNRIQSAEIQAIINLYAQAYGDSGLTAEEVLEYCAEKGYTHVDVDAFMAHYESVGWRVGKNPMVSWRAAVTGWETREKKETAGREGPGTRESASSFATEDFFAAAVRRSYGKEG